MLANDLNFLYFLVAWYKGITGLIKTLYLTKWTITTFVHILASIYDRTAKKFPCLKMLKCPLGSSFSFRSFRQRSYEECLLERRPWIKCPSWSTGIDTEAQENINSLTHTMSKQTIIMEKTFSVWTPILVLQWPWNFRNDLSLIFLGSWQK